MLEVIRSFIRWEAAGGVLLVATSIVAIMLANSPLDIYYDKLLSLTLSVQLEGWGIEKPLLLWINDGLMAVFFFMVGLELKREWMTGELSRAEQRWLPAFAAIGGMVVPAMFYAAFTWGDSARLHGWAIPAATDIAFALGVLSLLGTRVPVSLKVFLVSLAIIDDIGAIVVIALFYTTNLSTLSLFVASVCLITLFFMSKRKVVNLAAYIGVGAVLWVSVLKSGVHATLAGIALAMFIPSADPANPENKPAERLERELHTFVAFVVLPVFAFANAGVSLSGIGDRTLWDPVMLGIVAGLLLGKPIGVLLGAWLAQKIVKASLPTGVDWMQMTGAAFLCGIGFTMSLFITTLAFEQNLWLATYARLGILAGSIIAAIIGFLLIYMGKTAEQR